ncbi:MAG: hypothetical protein H8E48_13625, partial [Chloroflexi bacterium]|nr:hypothetical protein [Chloroflexota bacterium]
MPTSIFQIFNVQTAFRRAILLALVLSIAFFVMSSTASSLSAAGGRIEVVETPEAVDLPGNVDLSVTAQGDDNIAA